MANSEHVDLVKQGAAAIAEWRKINQGGRIDLSVADLTGINLKGANLAGANLWRTRFDRAELNNAILSGAMLNDATFVDAKLQSVDLSRSALSRARLINADLAGASLVGADLSNAYLCHGQLLESDFTSATLTDADLRWAVCMQANFSNANLGSAYLRGADFRLADLCEAQLQCTTLSWANLSEANLDGTAFDGATMLHTILADVDLSLSSGLERIQHLGPSFLDVRTLYRSSGQIPEVFLQGCGIPENLITYLHSLTGRIVEYFSCFISYTQADDDFSKQLYDDLQREGIRCWRWREDAKWGRTLMREVDESIRLHDKLVVILSEQSLQAEPVIREIERALQKESRDRSEVLFPIRVDDAIFTWQHELQADVLRKVIGDFRQWKEPVAYGASLERLIACLQATPAKIT